MKSIWQIVAPISAILTLATWLFFDYSKVTSSSPMNVSQTTFVFAFWFAVTLGASRIWRLIRQNSKKGAG
jgi:hypothetical protein